MKINNAGNPKLTFEETFLGTNSLQLEMDKSKVNAENQRASIENHTSLMRHVKSLFEDGFVLKHILSMLSDIKVMLDDDTGKLFRF